MKPNKLVLSALLASLALAALVAYGNSYRIPFHWDDVDFFEQSADLRAVQSFGDTFSFQYYASRPVSNFLIALDYWYSGYDLWSWHLLSILSHVAVAAAVFWLARLLWRAAGRNEGFGPWLAAALFVLHPVHTETLNMFHYRSAIYSALFCVISIIFFLLASHHTRGVKRVACWTASCAAALLAAGSKENAVILPALALLTDVFFYPPSLATDRAQWRQVFRYLLRFVPLGLAVAVIPLMLLVLPYPHRNSIGAGVLPYFSFVLTQVVALPWYLRYLIWPRPLNLDHDFPYRDHPDVQVLLSGVLIAALAAVIVHYRRRQPLLCFGLAWFLVAKIPTSFLVPMTECFAERFLYLPAVGFCVAAAYGVDVLAQGLRKRTASGLVTGAVTGSLVAAILVFFALSIHQRNVPWQDRLALCRDTVAKSPNKPRPWANLGHVLTQRGDFDGAGEAFRKAFELESEHQDVTLLNYAISRAWSRDYAEAEKLLLRIPDLPPGRHHHISDDQVYYNLGLVAFEQKAYARCVSYLGKIRHYAPYGRGSGFDVCYLWGQALRGAGQPEQALGMLERALKYGGAAPEPVRLEMAKAYLDLGRTGEADRILAELAPELPEARLLRQRLRSEGGRPR